MSQHLIYDEPDDEEDIITWNLSDEEKEEQKEKKDKEINEDDEIINDEIDEIISDPEIHFDIIEKNGEKSVKVNIKLNSEEFSNLMSIEFIVSKENFLNIAKKLN
jgi:hypothetical protein